jgi:hypothetical protein
LDSTDRSTLNDHENKMSQGVYLVCEATKQLVHVSEESARHFTGPETPFVVAAFCHAHSEQNLSVIGNWWHSEDYTEWTVKNVESQFVKFGGANKQGYLECIRNVLRELGAS